MKTWVMYHSGRESIIVYIATESKKELDLLNALFKFEERLASMPQDDQILGRPVPLGQLDGEDIQKRDKIEGFLLHEHEGHTGIEIPLAQLLPMLSNLTRNHLLHPIGEAILNSGNKKTE